MCNGDLAQKNCKCSGVCALRVREATSFSLEKKDNIYLTSMLAWRHGC